MLTITIKDYPSPKTRSPYFLIKTRQQERYYEVVGELDYIAYLRNTLSLHEQLLATGLIVYTELPNSAMAKVQYLPSEVTHLLGLDVVKSHLSPLTTAVPPLAHIDPLEVIESIGGCYHLKAAVEAILTAPVSHEPAHCYHRAIALLQRHLDSHCSARLEMGTHERPMKYLANALGVPSALETVKKHAYEDRSTQGSSYQLALVCFHYLWTCSNPSGIQRAIIKLERAAREAPIGCARPFNTEPYKRRNKRAKTGRPRNTSEVS